MRRSIERVLTTHTGSLPRSPELTAMLLQRDRGEGVDGIDGLVREDVIDIVQRQLAAGIDAVSDGEASKVSYVTYIADRLEGFGGTGSIPIPADLADYPEYARGGLSIDHRLPACTGPVEYRGLEAVRADIANLTAAVAQAGAGEAFMTAASPGTISLLVQNQYYETHEEYLWAIAAAMAPEYEAISAAGILLQLDCPDLAVGHHTVDGYDRIMPTHIDALNEATRNISPESMRMHVCWGNYEGPHHHDVPLGAIIEQLFRARPSAILFEGAAIASKRLWA